MNNNECPCLLCATPLPVRRDKHGKPYFVCDPCGMQLFVRREAGKRRLEALMQALSSVPEQRDVPLKMQRIRHLLSEVEGLREEIKNLKQKRSFWGEDSDLERQIAALNSRKDSCLAELETLCPRNR